MHLPKVAAYRRLQHAMSKRRAARCTCKWAKEKDWPPRAGGLTLIANRDWLHFTSGFGSKASPNAPAALSSASAVNPP
jgi:hypothetical protein